uniref:Immunoglobulin subtype domain-containing protein n=1 Tax=Gasterosteus aculeatus aculeatus TaxID=481459 RepID=A0AAQ4RQT8_GASAC|nr:uncharacterized protein LOC120821291 [Gasterosteus aculeatus aculeatus]
MRARWMFMVLLSCGSYHVIKTLDDCKGSVKAECVPVGGEVSVPCPNVTGEDVIIHLYKDHTRICNHQCTEAGMKLRHDNQSYTLTVVNSSSNGIYGCQSIAMFPPPLTKTTLCILVLVDGHQCTGPEQPCRTSGDQCDGFLWIWILGLVLLCSYSVIITIIASIIWVKWRSLNCQNDYMNTKPKAHKDQRKKRGGVQIPICRHF